MYMWPAQSRPFLCLSQTRGANISHMCVCSAQKVPSSPKYRRKSQIRVFAIAHTISINHFVGVMRTYYRNRNDDDLRPLSEQFEKNFYLFPFFHTFIFFDVHCHRFHGVFFLNRFSSFISFYLSLASQ